MAGITKIRIQSDWHDWRTEMEDALSRASNEIYRSAFDSIGAPLAPGYKEIECTKEEAKARYDYQQGIDVIFRFADNTMGTGQEKFLTFHKSTATFEERKVYGKRGAWYYCTAQYYFVGYARQWSLYRKPEAQWPKIAKFHDWMLLNLPALHRASLQELVPWQFNRNKRDNIKTSFRYVNFDAVPEHCIVARHNQHGAPHEWAR